MANNTNERNVETPFFVGYNMAKNGIGKAMIKEFNENTITLALCGDDEVYGEFFVMSKEDFNDNMKYLHYVIEKVGLENIAS